MVKSNERVPDVFFSLFEILADDYGWRDSDGVLLLQSVISGKLHEAYFALDDSQRKDYTETRH